MSFAYFQANANQYKLIYRIRMGCKELPNDYIRWFLTASQVMSSAKFKAFGLTRTDKSSCALRRWSSRLSTSQFPGRENYGNTRAGILIALHSKHRPKLQNMLTVSAKKLLVHKMQDQVGSRETLETVRWECCQDQFQPSQHKGTHPRE